MLSKKFKLSLNYYGFVLLNISLYIFLSAVIYYLLNLNLHLLKLSIIITTFIICYYLSSKNLDWILNKFKLKNILISTKFLLALNSALTSILIFNKVSLNIPILYLLILVSAFLSGILAKAYSSCCEKRQEKQEVIYHQNLEKIVISIIIFSTALIINVELIPLILFSTSIYYLISAYLSTF